MVTFKLEQECENYAIYHYWAENYEEKNPSEYGILAFDKDKMSYIIIELAPHDFQHTVSIEEQLEMRESAKRGRIEEGFPPLTEEEWPMPRSELIVTFYADHAYQAIKKNFKNGELLNYGKTFWY